MASIAFFLQRGEKEEIDDVLETENNQEIEEEENEKENNQEEEKEEDINDDNEIEEDIPENENEEVESNNEDADEIKDVDCGEANFLALDAKKDLAFKLGVNTDKINITSCQRHFFSDYTLGTSGPGEVYPQEETEGYIILLNFDNQQYRYHGNYNNLFYID